MVEGAGAQTGSARPVCIVAEKTSTTVDRIVLELARQDVPVFRFDLADFPSSVTLDASIRDRGWSGILAVHDRMVALEDIGAVLWWHPGKPEIATDGLSDAQAHWVRQESTAGVVGVLAALGCLQVCHPVSTLAAQLKAHVLARAVFSGLAVPATWIGNVLAKAVDFTAASGSGAVCKSLTSPAITHGDGTASSFYTSRIEVSQLDGAITASAHQLQHAVSKTYEVRLIVVGRKMFAARIDAHSAAARADFRADYGALTYSHIDIPTYVRQGVARLLESYGLLYAAIDLVVDPDDWWFVDLNPAGHHDWLQEKLPDLHISAAIADLLAHPGAAAM
ncbi:MvdC/MvdD family ATP grasp protein [Streptomyces sp. NPDC051985]|uniref:MvdC/MvdD family ATP grasp protein n=1 Tax=Streptomyces sp. NPDC051985 TaxID=3155807 RepID=UPI00342A5A47